MFCHTPAFVESCLVDLRNPPRRPLSISFCPGTDPAEGRPRQQPPRATRRDSCRALTQSGGAAGDLRYTRLARAVESLRGCQSAAHIICV